MSDCPTCERLLLALARCRGLTVEQARVMYLGTTQD